MAAPLSTSAQDAWSSDPTFTPTPGFREGRWEYICVDPTGLRLRRSPMYTKKEKNGGELHFGDLVRIQERGDELQVNFLGLADGRGWAFERTNRRRMSEVVYDPVPVDQQVKQFILNPELKRGLFLVPTPHIPSEKDISQFPQVFAGSTVRIRRKAWVTIQSPGDRAKDQPTLFMEIVDDNGHKGWVPETEERNLVEFCPEPVQPPYNWISVKPNMQALAYPAPHFHVSADAECMFAAGELLEVMEVFVVKDLHFFKLAINGCWICEKPSNAKAAVVEPVTLEPHLWAYICKDKEGAALRNAPTRAKNQKQATKLQNRQRVWATDIATFPDGDAFVHLSPPNHGWVPLTKKSGVEKMQALNESPPCNRSWLISHGVSPKPKAKAKSKPKVEETWKIGNTSPLKPLPVGNRLGLAQVRGSISQSAPMLMPVPPPSMRAVSAPPPSSMGMPLSIPRRSSMDYAPLSPTATCSVSVSPWHSHVGMICYVGIDLSIHA